MRKFYKPPNAHSSSNTLPSLIWSNALSEDYVQVRSLSCGAKLEVSTIRPNKEVLSKLAISLLVGGGGGKQTKPNLNKNLKAMQGVFCSI